MNPANAKFLCGAECGIATTGTLSAGTEHWASIINTATVVTSGPTPMRSTRCFRFNPSAVGIQLNHTFATAIAAPATVVARFYVYFATLPSGDTNIFQPSPASGSAAGVVFVASDSTLRARAAGGNAASGAAVTTGVWYRVDVKIVYDTTDTCDISVDGVAQTQRSGAGSSRTCVNVIIGNVSAVTADFYMDDIVVSGTSGDFPIGAGTVAGLYPSADRTNSAANPTDGNKGHLYSATSDFGKGASGGSAVGAQNAESTSWQSLANPLSTTIGSNWIADLVGTSAEHMMWELADLPSDALTINGVFLVATCHAASATTCQHRMVLGDGSGAVSYPFALDLSETTITVPTIILTTDNIGNAWTVSGVNACTIGFGDSTDVNPDPYLDGVCLEVDYVASVVIPNQSIIVPTLHGLPQAVHARSTLR